ncbi:hypothetical protein [Pseudoxanthomonas mexicana]
MRRHLPVIRTSLFWLLLLGVVDHFDVPERVSLTVIDMQNNLHSITHPNP